MPRHHPTSAPDSSGENFGPELAAAEEYISDDDADDYPPFQPPGVNATEDELRKVSCIDFFMCMSGFTSTSIGPSDCSSHHHGNETGSS
jgi:hypothetical protein